jgi:hypothetical protein
VSIEREIEEQVELNVGIDALLDRVYALPPARRRLFLERVNRQAGTEVFSETLIRAVVNDPEGMVSP